MSRLHALRTRIREIDPLRVDALLALAFTVGVIVDAIVADAHGESRALTAVLCVVLCSSLALRRRDPLAAGLVLAVALTAAGVVPDQFVFDNMTVPFFATLLMLVSIGRYADARALRWVVVPISVGLVLGIVGSDEGFDPADTIWFFVIFGLPLVAGRALRSRVLLQRELRDKAERAERERGARAQAAVEEERDRIAAELQAVVANGVSAMVVQAGAVPRLIRTGDTPRAGEALAVIEATGRDALSEMRRLLGVLRRDGDGPELAPQPGLGRLDALVERVRERGLDVRLDADGDRRPLSPGVDLTAYRVVEDALEAALERSATEAVIRLSFEAADVQIEVRDDRSGGASERLPGLGERVGLYGGTLRAGAPAAGGFRLTVRLPLREAA